MTRRRARRHRRTDAPRQARRSVSCWPRTNHPCSRRPHRPHAHVERTCRRSTSLPHRPHLSRVPIFRARVHERSLDHPSSCPSGHLRRERETEPADTSTAQETAACQFTTGRVPSNPRCPPPIAEACLLLTRLPAALPIALGVVRMFGFFDPARARPVAFGLQMVKRVFARWHGVWPTVDIVWSASLNAQAHACDRPRSPA